MLIRTVRVLLLDGTQERWVSEMQEIGDRLERPGDGLIWATVGLAPAPDGWVGLVTSVWTTREAMEARVADPPRPVSASRDAVASWTVDVVEVMGSWSTDGDPPPVPQTQPLRVPGRAS